MQSILWWITFLSSFGILMMIYSIYSIIADIAGEFIAIVAVLTSYRFHHLQNQFEFVTTALKDSWKTQDKLCKQIYSNKINCGSFSIIKLIQENWCRYKSNTIWHFFSKFVIQRQNYLLKMRRGDFHVCNLVFSINFENFFFSNCKMEK